MIVVPFLPVHLEGLRVHDYMGHMNGIMTEEYGAALADYPAYSCLIDGTVIACAGVYPFGVNRWTGWALMTQETAKYMLNITRAIKKFFAETDIKRIETHVRIDFKAGYRWAEMLGFKNETPDGMKAWGDDGHDYYLFARVK